MRLPKFVVIFQVENQLKALFEFNPADCLRISAKSGLNVKCVLDAIIEKVPAPNAEVDAPFRAIIFDSFFDHFRGAIAYINVKEGVVKRGDKIRSYKNDKTYEVSEVGIMRPDMTKCTELRAGQVGYLVCSMKTVHVS